MEDFQHLIFTVGDTLTATEHRRQKTDHRRSFSTEIGHLSISTEISTSHQSQKWSSFRRIEKSHPSRSLILEIGHYYILDKSVIIFSYPCIFLALRFQPIKAAIVYCT